jgi:hypothetical protein
MRIIPPDGIRAMPTSMPLTHSRLLRRDGSGLRARVRWLVGLVMVSAGCVNLTPPWEQVKGADAGTGGSGGIAVWDSGADVPLATGGAGGRTGAIDVGPGLPDAAGGAIGSGGASGPLDGGIVVPDVPVATGGTAGAIDGPPAGTGGAAVDVGHDVPIGGSGGAALDAAFDNATGGRGGTTASGGTTTGRGGTGGTSTGRGGSGGTTSSGGARTGGSSGSGGARTGGTTGTGGSGSGGTTSPVCSGQAATDAGAGGLTVGLVAYYPCESATGTTLPDQSGNGKDGILVTGTGGTAGYSFGTGKVGNALDFVVASKGYAKLPAGLLANTCEATVATWVYVNNNVNWQRIFDFGKDQTVYMFLATTNGTTSKLRFAISISGNGAGEQVMDGQAALPTAAWHHVAVVLGPSGGILYLDGAQVGANPTMTLRPADLANPPNYYIGKSQFTADPTLDGNVDEFRIYNRALSPTEIQALASGS